MNNTTEIRIQFEIDGKIFTINDLPFVPRVGDDVYVHTMLSYEQFKSIGLDSGLMGKIERCNLVDSVTISKDYKGYLAYIVLVEE